MTPASILIAVVPLLAGQASAGIFPRQEASASAASPADPTADVSSVLASAVSSATAIAATATGTAVSAAANASFTSNEPASPSAGEASSSAATASSGAATAAATGAGTAAGTPSGDDSTSASGVATTSAVASGDFEWVQTSGLPTITTTLATTNRDAITPTATGPVGGQGTPAVNFTDYSSSSLERFWNDWVGEVEEPPFAYVPEPPNPYPLPDAPPSLYPEYYTKRPKDILPGYKFPKDFLFGWATAAQQWEGAIKADGKGPSIWDWASRFPGFIADNTTSDVGDLGYYLYKEDLARIAALGANVYSFSLFWTRILPFGKADSPINQAGIDFYHDLIDYSWSKGIEPVVTLFHWDTPLALQLEYGGFASEQIIDDYVNYAETVFKAYNGSVHKWVTFNEPVVFCSQMAAPVNSTLPSNLNSTTYPYTCSYHLVLAHAKTVKRFRELNIQGQIAFKSDNFVGIPWREGNQDDIDAVERHQAYQIGIFAEPIYNTGDWPDIVKNDLSPDILPRFTDDEIEMIKCSADFFAIDGYRDGYVQGVPGGVEACVANISNPLWPVCNQVNFYDSTPTGWAIGTFGNWPTTPWLQNTWQFVRPFLADLVKRYPSEGGIYLSEFGFSEPFENDKNFIYQITQDSGRTAYFNSYLGEVLTGIVEDGLPVKGVFGWSMVDNFEWNSGLSTRFGVQYVDYNSPTLQRTFKRSALEMSEFWNAHRCSD